jgi:hypothetical protein
VSRVARTVGALYFQVVGLVILGSIVLGVPFFVVLAFLHQTAIADVAARVLVIVLGGITAPWVALWLAATLVGLTGLVVLVLTFPVWFPLTVILGTIVARVAGSDWSATDLLNEMSGLESSPGEQPLWQRESAVGYFWARLDRLGS